MVIGELISGAPFEDDFPAEFRPRSLKLLPCFTAFDTFRKTDVGGPSPRLESPRIIRAISSSIENGASILCVRKDGLLNAGDCVGSDVPNDSCPLWPIDAGGGTGGARGAVNSSSATGLLWAPGRLDARGGGTSRLVLPAVGEPTVFERLLSRDSVLWASANTDGTEEVEAFRSCIGAVTVGVERSGVGVFVFRVAGVRESPRVGLSACFAGGYVALELSFLCFGSSKGLTSESGDSTRFGD